MTTSHLDGRGRLLVIVRHAKSEQDAPSDHARRLTDRGADDAVVAGRWLAERQVVPQVVLVSSAARAVDTAEGLLAGISSAAGDGASAEPTVRALDELYGASAEEVLDTVRELPDTTTIAAVVGHNPTMAMTAQALAGDGGASVGNFPTCAVAVFEVPGRWADLEPGTATLVAQFTPDR